MIVSDLSRSVDFETARRSSDDQNMIDRRASDSPRVLLLMGSSEDAPSLNSAMRRSGLEGTFFQCSSAAAAMKALRDPKGCDAVVVAYRLRDANGIDCCRQLRSDPELSGIPLLLLIDAEVRELIDDDLRDAGVNDYLVKDEHGLYLKIFPYMIRDAIRERRMEIERAENEALLRRSERKYRELVENADSLIMRFGHDGVITFFNLYGEALLGYPKGSLIGASVTETLWTDVVGMGMNADEFLRALMDNPAKYTRYELSTTRRTGGRVWISWANHPIYDEDGACREILSVGVDVSHRVKMEEELTKAKERAELANRNKSSYLAKMSHEIRTPMNSIIGFANLALDTGNFDEGTRKILSIITAAGEELLKLIDDVLDLSKIEAGRMTIRDNVFHLPDALQTLMASFTPLVNDDVSLSCEVGPGVPLLVKTDQMRLTQILRNLVGNAVKHTLSGEVRLSTRLVDHIYRPNAVPGDVYKLNFKVSDTGPGIAPEELAYIFEPFRQSRDGATKPGAGLGLAIAKRLARLLDGDLSVHSEPGVGTVFELNVDVSPPDSKESGERWVDAEEDSNVVPSMVRVLCVDDEPNNQTLLSMLMKDDGHELVAAKTGRQALDLLEKERFDVVLMDLELPDMNGRDVAREIREREGPDGRRVPIIAVTAYAMKDDRDRCVDAGMDDYVSKPFKAKVIREKIRRHVGVPSKNYAP